MNVLELPFNSYIGLSLADHNGRQVVCLDPTDHHQNHVGTVHAAALYALAEAGSGHALLQQSDISDAKFVAVLRSSSVKYRRPVTAKAVAIASISTAQIEQLRTELASRGRALIDVPIRIVTSTEPKAMTADFTWFVARRESTASSP